MNVLIVDTFGYGLDLAMRMQSFGHDIRWYMLPMNNGERNTTGDGMIPKVPDWRDHTEWADLIVMTANRKFTKELDVLRATGYPVFGPTEEATQWEFDRLLGQQVLQDCRINTVPMVEFSAFKDAIEYIKKNPGRYACKPSVDLEDKATSHCGKSDTGKDLVSVLSHWDKTVQKRYPFVLQPFVKGIEMAVGGHFGRDGWVGPWVHNFEFKKLFTGDMGPNTGEMGTVVHAVEESLLAEMVLKPLTAKLLRMNYTGYIDIAVIVQETGKVCPLEFTSRSGWPLDHILNSVFKGDPATWRKDALDGLDSISYDSSTFTGLVYCQPDFPYDKRKKESVEGYQLDDSEKIGSNFHPVEIKMGEGVDDSLKTVVMPVSTGTFLAVITGKGDTVAKSGAAAYRNLGKISFSNSPGYRLDIGDRLKDQIPVLKRHGFVDEDFNYE